MFEILIAGAERKPVGAYLDVFVFRGESVVVHKTVLVPNPVLGAIASGVVSLEDFVEIEVVKALGDKWDRGGTVDIGYPTRWAL